MAFDNILTAVVLVSCCALLLWINKRYFLHTCKRLFGMAEEFTYEMYLAILCIHLVAAQQMIVFLLLDWHLAVVAWIVCLPLNIRAIKRLYEHKTVRENYEKFCEEATVVDDAAEQSVYYEGKFLSKRYVDKKAEEYRREWKKWEFLSVDDVREKKYGWVIVNAYHRFDWIWYHICGPCYIVVTWIVTGALGDGYTSWLGNPGYERIIYDAIHWYGIAALGYLVVYWLAKRDPIRIEEGWRVMFHVGTVAILLVWWIIFVRLQMMT